MMKNDVMDVKLTHITWKSVEVKRIDGAKIIE